MAITINGDTGLTLPASSSITGSSTTITGITSVASNAADTPIILQDSSSNSATCRAWVNFNGTGTVAIRADFNVSSITDGGSGDYTVNFTNAIVDADYCAQVSANAQYTFVVATPSTSSIRLRTVSKNIGISDAPNYSDFAHVYVAIFR